MEHSSPPKQHTPKQKSDGLIVNIFKMLLEINFIKYTDIKKEF